jgi:GGDEF-like domain
VQVAEILRGGEIDVDAMTTAIRYPLRTAHLAVVLWFPNESDSGNELGRLERCHRELAEALSAPHALFVAADRVSGWGWFAIGRDTGADPVSVIRRLTEMQPDGPQVAVGRALPDVEGFRRSHGQAQNARRVAIAAGPSAPRVIAASDPGLGPPRSSARTLPRRAVGCAKRSDHWRRTRAMTRRCARPCGCSCTRDAVTKPRPSN